MKKSNPKKTKRESRVALVTGGAIRVGRSICQCLARDFTHVAVHCNGSTDQAETLVEELEERGTNARVLVEDLTMPGCAARLISSLEEWSPGLDLLVNNAATFVSDDGEMLDLARMKVLNIDTPKSLLEAATPLLIETGGAVVNIADVAGFQAFENFKAYSATKRALLDLTWRAALALAPKGVRVNAVCPGAVLFPTWYTEETKENILQGIPMGVVGSPQDIAEAVAYLASAGFVTGQAISVDGGRMLVIDQD